MDVDLRPWKRARCDGHRAAPMQLRAQRLDLLDRRAEIGIAEDPMLARGGEHAEADGGALAGVTLECEHLELRPGLRDGARHRQGVVGAAVVDDQDLVGFVATVEVCADSLQRGGQPLLLVVGRNDDAQHRLSHDLARRAAASRRSSHQYTGSTDCRRNRHGWMARRQAHSRPTRRTGAGARRTRPARKSRLADADSGGGPDRAEVAVEEEFLPAPAERRKDHLRPCRLHRGSGCAPGGPR